ncbi:MAG: AMP-binding protein [Clostridia bacterium]|nr:AMP-binding protein [Clostridia bacterium]
MKKVLIYDVKQFNTVKEMLENSGNEFADRTAFVIKHKDEIEYENITYERFAREINSLGTALINMGFKDKKIAIIGKNRYEWVLAFAATVGGVRNSSSSR